MTRPGRNDTVITLDHVSGIIDDLRSTGEDPLVGIGGVVLRRKPMAIIARLCRDAVAPLRVAQSTWPDEVAKWDNLNHLAVSPITGTPVQRRAALLDQLQRLRLRLA